MITRTEKIRQTPVWQHAMASAIKSIDELLDIVQLSAAELNISEAARKQFSLRIPMAYVDNIRPGDPHDPLLKQILPVGEEMRTMENYLDDPVADLDAVAAKGLLHKYHGRVLLLTTGACAIHCRYCFRRHFPYHEHSANRHDWTSALDYIKQDTSIHEVILSGGDPLTLNDDKLSRLVKLLEDIPHVQTLRLHTRLPVVLPQRICDELLTWISRSRLNCVVVIHSNHAQEMSESVIQALQRLQQGRVILLNQAVLLRGINDNVDKLTDLSHRLFAAGVLPYYLHQLDPVNGAAHFQVSDERACYLHEQLRHRLPGYLVPRLVQELPGLKSKSPLVDLMTCEK